MRFLTGWVAVCGLGCAAGCGSSGTSPVVEYNAAQEAYDRELAFLKQLEQAVKGTTGKEKEEFQEKVKLKEITLQKLRESARKAESKL